MEDNRDISNLGWNIRAMSVSDVPDVVRIHQNAFIGFFLSFLGPRFLRELYQAIVEDDTCIKIVYEDQEVQGFVVGAETASGFYGRLIKKRVFRFAIASIPALVKSPKIICRLIKALNMENSSRADDGTATLLSIAVEPNLQGRGIGNAVIQAFISEARIRGMRKIHLYTDKLGNDPVNHFYQRLGFVCVQSFTTPENRAMNEYQIEIS